MKRIMMFIIIVAMCLCLCSCKKEERDLVDHYDKITFLEMQISITKAAIDLSDSNHSIIQSLDASNMEEAITYFSEGLNFIKYAQKEVSDTISSPNFISDNLEELRENYERTLKLFEKFPDISEEEDIELVELVSEGTEQHVFLLKYVLCFVNLYRIRNFDKLPNAEARETMKETWWEFGFEDDIKYDENINKQDLYLIWAAQFFDSFDEAEFLEELQLLRDNDDLSSKDYNQKWAEFIENFISDTEKGNSIATPLFIYILIFVNIFYLYNDINM